MVGGSLWLLYPRQDLERRLATSGDIELSIAYLHNLLRSDRDNAQLRLLLAKRQLVFGDVMAADQTLQPLLDSRDEHLRNAAQWVKLDAVQLQYQRALTDDDSDQRAVVQQALLDQASVLARQPLTPPQQARLAALARQVQESSLAAELARQQPAQTADAAQVYAQAARQALAESDYAACAQLYIQARHATLDPVQAKRYYNAAIAALRSGNQAMAALALAERELGELADDPQALMQLVELARAAGQGETAQRYTRLLLKISWLRQWNEDVASATGASVRAKSRAQTVFDDGAVWLGSHKPLLLRVAFDEEADPVEVQRPAVTAQPHLPFNEQAYDLGYQVFVENGNLDDAWSLANAAVRRQPSNMLWRERLAQVSEWTSRSQTALQQWLVIAQTTGQAQAWQAVLRLAPGLFDDGALVLALRHELRRRPSDLALMRALVQAQERLGEPQPAIDYLRAHADSPESVEMLAQLAERAGQPDLALQTWERLLGDSNQVTAERAMHAALLALQHGQRALGLRWILAAQGQQVSPDEQTDFLRLTAQLAQEQGLDEPAAAAYFRLLEREDAELSDHDALIHLLQRRQPLEAARVSVLTWRRYDEPSYLIDALTIYVARNQWDAFAQALAQLDPSDQASRHSLRAMQRQPEFLRLLGIYHQNEGRLDLARRYLQAGLQLLPDSPDMQQAMLWLLIDSNDAVSIRQLLAEREAQWSRSGELHEALAAAYQALSLPQVALERYLTPHLAEHREDFLWLMNYADALEQNQQADRAWRLRRGLLARQWQRLRQASGAEPRARGQAVQQWLAEQGLDATRRVARARLLMDQRPGDPALEVLRELLRLDEGASGKLSNAAAETALAWLQDRAEFSAERAYLWHQYARSRSLRANRPLWADITVALAEDDRQASGALLERFDERLPRYDRVNAAAQVGDVRLAQSAAFEAQGQQRDDEPLQEQLEENLLAFSDRADLSLREETLDAMAQHTRQGQLHLAISPELSLDLNAVQLRRSMNDAAAFRALPNEEALAATLRWRRRDSESRLQIASRVAYARTTPLLLRHEQRMDRRLSWYGEIGWHQPADATTGLRLAGMTDRVGAGLSYRATRQDQLNLSLSADRYRLQTGAGLGSGRHAMLEYIHSLRQDTPSLEIGGFWSFHRFRQVDPASLGGQGRLFQRHVLPAGAVMERTYFVPESFRFYGLQLSTNTRFEQEYSRALRPYASLSRTWHSTLGAGYGVRLGLTGSVVGADRLVLSWEWSRSGLQSSGLTRGVQLSYRLFF
ncbi:tetratricopeptide repeat protein [Comamonas sp. NLF-1-9]|nr:tetratricopeptide repeat protein [Comamonas sp. NLF-1-9]